jgi:hypothetical protein
MTYQEQAELLRKSEDAYHGILAGKERHFFWGKQTIALAGEHDIDINALAEELDEDMPILEQLEVAVDIVWMGCKVCAPSLEREEIDVMLSAKDGQRLNDLLPQQPDETPPSARPGPPEGK